MGLSSFEVELDKEESDEEEEEEFVIGGWPGRSRPMMS